MPNNFFQIYMSETIWHVLEIHTAEEASEAVEFALNQMNCTGTEINNLGKKNEKTICINGYFQDEKPDERFVRGHLSEALRIYGFSPETVEKTDWRVLGNVDWLYQWRKYWSATEIGKFIVAPTWEEIEKKDKIIVWIDPDMAFGTGTHPTTQLCLNAIGDLFSPEMSFLDVGTGTGILVIGAAKIKFEDERTNEEFKEEKPLFLACDTDENSVRIARQNAELNKVSDKISFFAGSVSEETPEFDFVCANLTIDVITPLLSLLLEKSRRILVLSGILKEQQPQIEEELTKYGIKNAEIQTLGEWICVIVSKNI